MIVKLTKAATVTHRNHISWKVAGLLDAYAVSTDFEERNKKKTTSVKNFAM